MALLFGTTTAAKQTQFALKARLEFNSNLASLKAQAYTRHYAIFNNTSGLTPQEVADSLGTDAAAYFAAGTVLKNAILSIDSTWTPPTLAYTVTANQDGTVTLTAI